MSHHHACRPSGGNSREIYCPPYSKDFTENSPKSGVHDMVHMIPERDTDSVAPTPTPQHPRHSQHHHLSLHELRALQVCRKVSSVMSVRLNIPRVSNSDFQLYYIIIIL